MVTAKASRLLAIGGAHLDRRGQLAGLHIPATSNPGRMHEEVGGGVFNAARTAARRGIAVSLLSLRGGDAAGEQVASAVERAGFDDLSAIFLDRATPSYTAILDQDGELITGLADMGLYETAFAKQLRRRKCREAAAAADAILCDANLPEPALAQLVAISGTAPIHAIAVSPAKAGRLIAFFGRLTTLFMNSREARSLAGLGEDTSLAMVTDRLRRMGLTGGVITAGSHSVLVFADEDLWQITPPPVAQIADVTGAGDALAGATIAALMHGESLPEAVRHGVAAAGLAVASASAAPEFDANLFAAALALVPAPRAVS